MGGWEGEAQADGNNELAGELHSECHGDIQQGV